MEQPHTWHILYFQYLACWCPGDLRSQGISRHDTDPQSQNILSPASEELKPMIPKSLQITSMISAAKLLWIYQNTWHRSPKKLSLSLNNIILTLFNFSFTSELEVKKDCKCTQTKTWSNHDGISVKLLKFNRLGWYSHIILYSHEFSGIC